jgi:hypothetical protein
VNPTLWRVDRQLQVVGADAIAMRVRIAEQASQQHLVRAGSNARHHIRWLKGGLLDLGKEVLRVAIKHEAPHGNGRIVRMRPDGIVNVFTFIDEFSPRRELFRVISSENRVKLPEKEDLFPTFLRKWSTNAEIKLLVQLIFIIFSDSQGHSAWEENKLIIALS